MMRIINGKVFGYTYRCIYCTSHSGLADDRADAISRAVIDIGLKKTASPSCVWKPWNGKRVQCP
jgi:hypothetical protein